MSRIRALLALTALATASLVGLAAPAAHATTKAAADPSYDNSSSYDGRGDTTSFGVDYRDNLITVGISVRLPVDPATDYNWVTYSTGAIYDIDVNGDNVSDYWASLANFNGLIVRVHPESNWDTTLCNGTSSYSGGIFFINFPASCIGSPVGVSVHTYLTYSTGSTRSADPAPDSGFGGAVTRTVTNPDPTTTTTTTTTQPQPDPTVHAASHGGYWMVARNGHVSPFGASSYGDAPTAEATHIEPTPDGNGYWVLAANGNVFSFGDAANLGNAGMNPGENAVSLSAISDGYGYLVFTDRGRAIPFGDAHFYGDMSGTHLNGPVLGSVATPSGLGYWMVASDGGIFTFGDATFHGSTGATKLNKPVMAMAPAADGSGYWLVASDGGIFAFDVPFYGSMGGTPLNKPISGMVPGSGGYMMVGQDGGVFSFGNVAYHGSLGNNPSPTPIVSAALQP